MPLLLGFMIGDAAGRIVFSRLVLLMALWVAIPLLSGRIVAANVSQTAGVVAAVAVPVAVLVWALVRPSASTTKLTLLDGLFAWCRIVALICAGRLGFKLFEADLVVSALTPEWRTAALMAFALLVSVALRMWIDRDAQNAGADA